MQTESDAVRILAIIDFFSGSIPPDFLSPEAAAAE
jgi:hypothetical protein